MERIEAVKATRNGAIAAAISWVLTLAVVLIAITSDSEGALALWNDPANYFDVFLIFVCAFGMYKKSRAASVLIFVYFIFAKVFIGLQTGN